MAQKTTIRFKMFDEIFEWGCICKVAAALSGDAQFPAGFTHFLEQQGGCVTTRRLACSHQSGGTSPDNDHIVRGHVHTMTMIEDRSFLSKFEFFIHSVVFGD